MRIIRLIGNIALWFGALLGLAAGCLYLADAMGWAQPLIVISGSMEPGISTGDLLIDTKVKTADLEVGDIVSLPSDLTHKLVSHRITQIEPADDGTWKIYMQGDANEFEDIAPYVVGDEVLRPTVRLPHVGFIVAKLMQPSVAMPIVIALAALLGMSLLDGGKASSDDDDLDDSAGNPDDSTDELDRFDELIAGRTYDDEPVRLPFPAVAGNLLLETRYVRPSHEKPVLSDRDALAELDAALAALGVHVETDATTQLDRDLLDRVLTG